MDYASNAKGNTGVTLGAIGTGLGAVNALGGMGALAGLFGGGGIAPRQDNVSRHEMDLIREIIDTKQANAILAADGETEKKMVEVYTALAKQDKEIRADIENMRRHQEDINREQAVYNGVNTATIGCIKSQVDQLLGLTKLVIPNSSCCPGWGAVNVTPVTPTP